MELNEIFKKVMGYYPTSNMEDVRIMNIITRTISVVCMEILTHNPQNNPLQSTMQEFKDNPLVQAIQSSRQTISHKDI